MSNSYYPPSYTLREGDTPWDELHYVQYHGDTIPLVEGIIKVNKPELCVCIGTGDGCIPRVLRESQIASGNANGKMVLIDLGETMGAMPEQIHDPNSVFRTVYPDIDVFKGYSVPDGITYLRNNNLDKIDVLWIDGDHSFNGAYSDFVSYAPMVKEDGYIFMHDIAPNGANAPQPDWCGVDQALSLIQRNYGNKYECLTILSGFGLAILKPRVVQIKPLHDHNSFLQNIQTGPLTHKSWDYLYSPTFLMRQRLIAQYLHDSPFVLDIGCFPISVGAYLPHDRYLCVDPLYPSTNGNIISAYFDFNEHKGHIPNVYDVVLIGIELESSDNTDSDTLTQLITVCQNARRVILESARTYDRNFQSQNDIVDACIKHGKTIVSKFEFDFSNSDVPVGPNSWPVRGERLVFILE